MSHRIPFFPLFGSGLLIGLLVLCGCQESLPAPTVEQPPVEEPAAVSTDSPPATDIPTPTPVPLPELTFAVQETASIPANNEAVTAENGVTVQIAPDALGDGVAAELSQWTIDPSWQAALEQVYTIDAPFVSLAAAGVNDSQGRAVLRLPATNSDSRLVAVRRITVIAIAY